MLFECLACWSAVLHFPRRSYGSIYFVDKTGERFFHITSWSWGAVLGFIVALSTMSKVGRYISLFLMTGGFVGKSPFLKVFMHSLICSLGSGTGLAMVLVWVSNAIPRPPACATPDPSSD